ncbi:PTS sugar transporter subunit IIA [Terribacillus saccharophilus]|uniref:PTS sugar transporter subunit IIA n=1 Tax=Terribacillus saccharophilus TaxID=361277 RepID=UPI003981F484
MKKFIIASHGNLAKELKNSVQMIMGDTYEMEAVCMDPERTMNSVKEEISEKLNNEDENSEYIILTDVLGGSIANLCAEFTSRSNIHVITGFNLSLVLEMLSLKDAMSTNDLIDHCLYQAKNGIVYVNELLSKGIPK